jgi:hypothetical protein
MTLTPAEATPRALALLTLAHELYANIDGGNELPHAELEEAELHAVLADDDGEIDWQAIAIAMGMIGHVLLDTIPEKLYEASEETLTQMLAQHFNTSPDTLHVTINNKVTGTNLLRAVSLKVLEMNSHE